jgi:hypothetical protein
MSAIRVSSSLAAVVSAMLVALTACATPAAGVTQTRHLRVINTTFDGVTALAVAPSGSADFQSITMAKPLAGGLTSVTVDVPAGQCRRDVRVTFHGDRTLLYPNLDVCHSDGLRLASGAATGKATRLLPDGLQAAGSP